MFYYNGCAKKMGLNLVCICILIGSILLSGCLSDKTYYQEKVIGKHFNFDEGAGWVLETTNNSVVVSDKVYKEVNIGDTIVFYREINVMGYDHLSFIGVA